MVIAGVVGGIAAAGASAYGAKKASKTNNKAIKAGQQQADRQADLADEQWRYNRDVYLPHASKLADDNFALNQTIANESIEQARHNRELSDQSFDQAKKSWKYQDEYMSMVDDYTSGNRANTMADEANADVEQAYGNSADSMQRAAARYGINPGSGAFAGAMGDLYSSKTLAAAGAQTSARRLARDKAEQMVGIAAGSGQAGFGTGLSAAGLATGAYGAASGAAASGMTGVNSVAQTFNQGASSAGSNYYGANKGYMNTTGGVDPFTAYASGMLQSGLKVGAANNWFTSPGTPGYSGSGGGDGGFSGTFDAYASGIYPD